MDEAKKAQLKEQLEEFHVWPSIYMFKFIFPNDESLLGRLKSKFPEEVEYSIKNSSTGKYMSVTVKEMVLRSEIVFQRYEDVSKIEGIISL